MNQKPLAADFQADLTDYGLPGNVLWCSDLADLGIITEGCCSSCHDDWNEGYDDPIEYEHDGHVWARVCCAVALQMDEEGFVHYLDDTGV